MYKHVSDEYSFHKGGANTKDARELIFARQSLVTHTKAFGLDAIDLVDTNFKGTHACIYFEGNCTVFYLALVIPVSIFQILKG